MPAIPLKGDRSAWDSTNYPELHASDLSNGTPISHVPIPAGTNAYIYSSDGVSWTSVTSGASLSFDTLSLTKLIVSGSATIAKLYVSGSITTPTTQTTKLIVTGSAVINVLSAGSATIDNLTIVTGISSKLNTLSDVHTPSPKEGEVLTWSATSASWIAYPIMDWVVGTTQDNNTDDSDKTFTIPINAEWQILWVYVDYTSTSVVGNRQMEVQFQDSGSTVIGRFQSGVTQSESLNYKYMFGIGVPDFTSVRDTNNVMTPLPAGTFLSAGQKLRIWDNKAVDVSFDDMVVKIQYAYRNLTIPTYYVLPVKNTIHTQTSGSVALFARYTNGTRHTQTSTSVILSAEYNVKNSILAQTSTEIVLLVYYPENIFEPSVINKERIPTVTSTTLSTNPVTGSFSTGTDATLMVMMIAHSGSIARTGGNPTFNGISLTQADSDRYGLTSGEATAEMWYLLYPPTSGSYPVSVPNSGTQAISIDMASAKGGRGYKVTLDATSGSQNTGATTNPYATITTTKETTIIFSNVVNGATTWSPSARTGSSIFDRDNGSWGESSQYNIKYTTGTYTESWTFGTSEDWGVVISAFAIEPSSIGRADPSFNLITSDNITLTAYPP